MAESRHTPGPNMDKILLALKQVDGLRTRVGYFSTNKYEDGTPVAYVASIQEFGHGPIPPRPFFRPTIADRQNYWRDIATRASKSMVNGERTAHQVFDLIGLQAAGDIRAKIASITSPALSILTLMARKARKEAGKTAKKNMKFGPQQKFKMGGAMLGKFAKQQDAGPPDVSGVSTKPLVDTRIMLPTLTHITDTDKT